MTKPVMQTLQLVGGAKITGLPTPVDPSDAAPKSYADTKQAELTSGVTIKTINGVPVLGSGDLVVSAAPNMGLDIAMRNNNFMF